MFSTSNINVNQKQIEQLYEEFANLIFSIQLHFCGINWFNIQDGDNFF
jgi:hypothetical protein